jgi:hypothetical protein
MNKCNDKVSGLIFDDWTPQEQGQNYDTDTWTQVCTKCANKHKLKNLDDAGQGICGVEGCENESDYYYDFNREE